MAMSMEPGELLRGGSGCPLTDRVPSGGANPLYCNVHRVPKVRSGVSVAMLVPTLLCFAHGLLAVQSWSLIKRL